MVAAALLTPVPPLLTEGWLSCLDVSTALLFRNHLGTAAEIVVKGVSPGRTTSCIGQWQAGIDFTSELGIDPFLEAFKDKVTILQVIIHQVCSGKLAAKGNQIKSGSVEDYLPAVAQIFLSIGVNNIRLSTAMKTDFFVKRMLQ